MSRRWNRKKPPAGWDYIEPTMEALDRELRDAVDAPHEGFRKSEAQWPIFQINWQRSRYIYDLYYKVRQLEVAWRVVCVVSQPVILTDLFDLFALCQYKKISKQLYDYCIRNKLVDAPLIAKWKKPGYERLCSVHAINTSNQNFGTTSICRVPRQQLRPGQIVEARLTGCRGCCSGPGGYNNIFGNKYGQYLAAIQVAREAAAAKLGQEYTQDKKRVFAEDHDEVCRKFRGGVEIEIHSTLCSLCVCVC